VIYRKTWRFLGAVVLMLALATAVQIARERTFAFAERDAQVLYVRSGVVMRRVALSYSAVLADLYWIRALQYYGRERLKPGDDRGYDLLYPLLDLSTSLDPLFTVGYRFGAIFLAEPHPGGAGRPDQAIALLEKGVAANPRKWDYYHDIGFIYYWNLHDYKSAAAWFTRGGELPGAPWWLKTYAGVMLIRGGDRQSSRAMWERLGQSEENDWLRQTSQLRLMQLDALDQIDTLQTIVREFARVNGALPRSWEQLVAARMLAAIPVDPSGTVYSLDFTMGIVSVPSWSKIYPLPTEPAAAPELKTPAP
jgi:tetratricopeptide (TPR) repeat protein